MTRQIRFFVALALAAGLFAPAQSHALSLRAPCDQMDKALCLLPCPNDSFTRADPSTDTGRRVDISILETPRSIAGKPIDPAEWDRQDGFSPGSMSHART